MLLQLNRAVCLLFAATALLWSSASAQSTIADCSLFADGPNATWTHVLTLTTASDAGSSDAQSFSINIASLPDGGANYRVYKTTANGSDFFGNAQALSIGENGATIAGVGFDRTVKIQFSSGDIEFDALSINGEAQNSCFASPDAGTAISACPLQFAAGANANWAHVLTLTTASDAGSAAAQSFSMNVTSLPAGGANYRVYKTTANGSDFFGNPQALSVGPNSTTVAGVSFDRTVKIQFSSGDVQFDALTVNGEAASCEEAPAPATAPSDNAADPTLDPADVASVYGDTYSSIANNYDPNWGQSGHTLVNPAYDPGTGNPVLAYPNMNYQGTDLAAQNLSSMTHLHVDVWVSEANSGRMLKVSPINNGTGAGEYLVEVPTTPGSWNSVDLAKADFAGMTWDNVFQMKFDGQFNADGSANGDGWDVYLDNLYFYNDGSGTEVEVTYVDVTFNVNMANEDVSADGVFLAGGADFGFPGDNPMSDDDEDGIWTITKQVIAPYTGNYTFLNGNCGDWSCTEDISGQDCADGQYNDRLLSNITENHVVNTCFGECTTDGSCPPPPSIFHDVTFSVNTDNITVGPNGMYVGGGFLGGSDAYALTDNGDNNWSTTISIAEGTSGHWVFFNSPTHGGDWGTKENLDGLPCGDPANYNDRFLAAVTGPTTEEYCFGTCEAECPAPATTYNVTFRVDMNNFDGDFGVVNINGSFNGWCGGCNPMSDDDADGVYEVTLPLEEGTIEYKFTLDGWSQQEEFQPGGSCTTTIDGFTNRSLTIEADTDLSAVCYNSCDACQSAPGCTDSGAVNYDSAAQNDDGSCLYAVTFQVDLSARGLADGDIVYTNGTYNGWCGGCNAMTDAGDGLWTGTFNLPAGDQEYKFTINGWNDQEFFDGTESCTTDPAEFVNRVVNISGATTLPVVCWNSCEACPLVAGCMDSGACNYNADAEVDDASCTYPPHANFDCDGNCHNDADGDGICDELEGLIPELETACGIGTMWDAELGECVFNVECAGDINLDGAITSGDILLMLFNFGTYCPGYGPDAE